MLDRIIEVFTVNPWVYQVFITLVLTAVASEVRRYLFKYIARKSRKTKSMWDDALVDAIQKPAGLIIWIAGVSLAIDIVHFETNAEIFVAVPPIRSVAIIATLGWFLIRLVENLKKTYVQKKKARGEDYNQANLDAVVKVLRLVIVITAALVAMQTLGFSIAGILAFGGVGGIAVGFAAKELISNFFGGLMLYLDRPFVVGDTITSSDMDVEGTVEEIGWRQTVIRRFDSRTLYVPNSVFTTLAVRNLTRQTNRRIFEYVGIRYDDSAALTAIVDDVRAMLESHSEIDKTNTLMVNFDRFAPSSLDIFIYCFTKTVEWAKYHQVKQEVLVEVMNIIEKHGAEIAFPTSTLHLSGPAANKYSDENMVKPADRQSD